MLSRESTEPSVPIAPRPVLGLRHSFRFNSRQHDSGSGAAQPVSAPESAEPGARHAAHIAHAPAGQARPTRSFLTTRESVFPLSVMFAMYMMRGFTFGMLSPLNKHFQDSFGTSKGVSALIQVSNALGVVTVSPTLGLWTLRRAGYKKTVVAGLFIYSIGALLFWPAGQYRSYPVFCFATAIIAAGASLVELSTQPYINNTGPPKQADIRVNLSMAFYLLGQLGGLMVVSYAIYSGSDKSLAAIRRADRNLMLLALGDGVFTLGLALLIYLIKLPEMSDEDLAAQLHRRGGAHATRESGSPWRNRRLWFGVFAMFCYTGSGASMGAFYVNYLVEVIHLTAASSVRYMALGIAINLFGRILFSASMHWIKPRYVLLVTIALTLSFQIPVATPIGIGGLACLLVETFFRGPIHPTSWSLTLKGLGSQTKVASSVLTAADSGGAFWTPIMGVIADAYGVRNSVIIPIIALSCLAVYPIWLNITYGSFIDRMTDEDDHDAADHSGGGGGGGGGDDEDNNDNNASTNRAAGSKDHAAPTVQPATVPDGTHLPAAFDEDGEKARHWSETTISSVNSIEKEAMVIGCDGMKF